MNRIAFVAIVAFFALFAVSFAQEEESGSQCQCQPDAQAISSEMARCLGELEEGVDKCPCFNVSYHFYKNNFNCMIDSRSNSYYDAYVRQANYYGCKELIAKIDCDNITKEYFDEAKTCLDLYAPENKASDPRRCECIESLSSLFKRSSCKKSGEGNTSDAVYKLYSSVCANNGCSDCSTSTCQYDAEDSNESIASCLYDIEEGDDKCSCYDSTYEFYEKRKNCKYEANDYYKSFLRQAESDSCTEYTRQPACESEVPEVSDKVDMCLSLLEPATEGETKTPNYLRCGCIDIFTEFLSVYPMCKHNDSVSEALIKGYSNVCEFNGCDGCSALKATCDERARYFVENVSDACIERVGNNDGGKNDNGDVNGKCACIEGYVRLFSGENEECKDVSAYMKETYDKYVTLCNEYECGNCPKQRGLGAQVVPVLALLAFVISLFI